MSLDREHGSGGVVSQVITNADRRERLRKLALETIDLSKDIWVKYERDPLPAIECKLCLTLHKNHDNLHAHTKGRRNQLNLARRAEREQLKSGSKVNV